jgi:hypothetical protein
MQVPYKVNVVEWKSRLATLESDDEAEEIVD